MLAQLLTLSLLLTQQTDEPREVSLRGKVVALEAALTSRGAVADATTVKDQFVLETVDGKLVPLIWNVASRALLLDERLRNRPIAIEGLERAGVPYLEVVLFRVEFEGQMRVPEYWCDVCAISVRYPQICPCCQGSLELRYKPADATR